MHQMKLYFVLLCIVASIVLQLTNALGKSTSKAAVVPCGKKRSIFEVGHNLLKKAVREAKLPFCSDLERITLKLTRPTPVPIDTVLVKQLVSLLNTDYDDPQLMIGLLVKLSRKYSETNVFTKTKSLLVMHRTVQQIHSKAQSAVSKSFSSLQLEIDEKRRQRFFSKDSLVHCGTGTDDAAALEAVELCRQYSQYVFDYVVLRGENNNSKGTKRTSSRKASKESEIDRAEAIMSLLALGEVVEAAGKRVNAALGQQCSDSVREDRAWALVELKQLHKAGAISDANSRAAVELVLSRLEPKKSDKKLLLKASNSAKIRLPNATASRGISLKSSKSAGTASPSRPGPKSAPVSHSRKKTDKKPIQKRRGHK